jgi:hypothetical protein
MQYGGDSGAFYRDQTKTVFRPGLATRTSAEILKAAAEVGQSLERQLGRVNHEAPRRIVDDAGPGCKYPWKEYCRAMFDGVSYALASGQHVIVVTQPYEAGAVLRARHMDQQAEMSAMLTRRFGGDARLLYVNLGNLIDVSDPALSFDRLHLTAPGNVILAESLVAPVMAMADRRSSGTRRVAH